MFECGFWNILGEILFNGPPVCIYLSFVKFATCIPSICTNDDAMFGMNTFLAETNLPLVNVTKGCQSEEDTVELNAGDWVMIAFLMTNGLVILVSTLIDMYQRFVEKDKFADHFLGIVQGFLAYHNTRQVVKTLDVSMASDSYR